MQPSAQARFSLMVGHCAPFIYSAFATCDTFHNLNALSHGLKNHQFCTWHGIKVFPAVHTNGGVASVDADILRTFNEAFMKTDWKLIRETMNAAIDSCERLEQNGYAERHRDLTVDVRERPVSIYEFMVSAWTMPENARYEIVRQRHEKGIDLPYVPESARILTAVAEACAELVGAGETPSVGDPVRGMIRWYRNHFDPNVERAILADATDTNER
jgi:hypothetical protein